MKGSSGGVVALIAALATPVGALPAQSVPAHTVDTMTVRSYDGRTMPASLIRMTVPERRGRPGRDITVAALRFATTAATPGNPIVFLMGGPGIPGTVMAPIPPYFTLFERLRERAEVIVVDQRGIGRSEPVLDCLFGGPLPADVFTARDRLVAPIRRQVAACAAQWRERGADPTAYTTMESADDINDLRRILGAERVDLLAFSYGTRLALAVAHRYGAHVGRMVLQGVNGPGLVLKRPSAIVRKLGQMRALLARDSAWPGSPDLLDAARAARERLARSPATVTFADRRGGQPVQVAVGRDGFDAIVGLNLDDARLPALLVSVAAGDDRVLGRFVEGAWNGLGGGGVGLMARAVNCAADRPAARMSLIERESAAAPFGEPVDNAFLTDDFCRAVGYEVPAVEFSGPLGSDRPALLITGMLDATNPVENAREVARGLPNAVLLDVEYAAHEALTVPAVQDLVVDFLRGVDVRGRRIAAAPPRFATVEEALRPPGPRR